MSKTETVGEIAEALKELNATTPNLVRSVRVTEHGYSYVIGATKVAGQPEYTELVALPQQSIVALVRSLLPPMSPDDALKILGKAAESQNDAFRRALEVLRKAVKP